MSTEQNKEVVRRFYEVFNSHNLDGIDAFVAPDFVDHNSPPGLPADREGFKVGLGAYISAFPDANVSVEDMVAEGDLVTDRGVLRGTHQGPLLGIPATGKQVASEGINIWRVAEGKLVEMWHVDDILGLLMQLGVVPPPPNPETTH